MIEAEFHPGALAETEEAQLWYEAQRAGLGDAFWLAIEHAIRTITEVPYVAQAGETAVRRHVIQRFPYTIAYVVLDSRIVVLAVAHSRRRPGYWRDRLRSIAR